MRKSVGMRVIVSAMAAVLALVGCSSQPTEKADDTPIAEEETESEGVDKTALKEILDEVESTTLEGLTLATGTSLSNAHDEAVTVMGDDEANQAEVDSAERALISAFDRASRESKAYDTVETSVEEAPKTSFGEGMHLVGTDIEAGEYKLTATSDVDGYWKVTGSSVPDADIIGNDIFTGTAYVTVTDGQYLTVSRCTGEKVN